MKYVRAANEVQSPEHDPIITQLRVSVRGHENLFVKVLEKHDLERISRQNSHKLCDWRTLHDHGQGILLHLSDIGLTRDIPFPKKKRVQIEVSLVSDETEHSTIAAMTDQRQFHVVVVRQNQLLSGDSLGCRFSFVND